MSAAAVNERYRAWVLAEVERAHAASASEGRPFGPLVVTIGNAHLPARFSSGQLVVTATLPQLFEAFAEDISAFIGDLEIGVSEAGGTPLSPDSYWCPVSGAWMVEPCLVRDRGEW